MSALRCSQCGTNWPPDYKAYSPACPECSGDTAFFSNATAIDADEAKSRKSHADFERYLDETGRRTQTELLDRSLGVT